MFVSRVLCVEYLEPLLQILRDIKEFEQCFVFQNESCKFVFLVPANRQQFISKAGKANSLLLVKDA